MNTWKLQSHRSHSNRYMSKQQKHPGGWGHAGGMHRHRTNCNKCHQVPLEKLTWVNAARNKTGAAPIPNVMPHK
ncbi:60S ribosomal protein L27a [Lemmus lemmus]